MKTSFCLFFFVFFITHPMCYNAAAQTAIYLQTFNSGTATEWSLDTWNMGEDDSPIDNQWIINNVYAGGGTG
jgi:hypothetical protein